MEKPATQIGLGIALGAGMGAATGVFAGHIAIWLAVGIAIGVVIGSNFRGSRCAECEADHERHRAKRQKLAQVIQKGVHHGTTRESFHIGPRQSQ